MLLVLMTEATAERGPCASTSPLSQRYEHPEAKHHEGGIAGWVRDKARRRLRYALLWV